VQILRWISFSPAAFIAGWLAYVCVRLTFKFGAERFYGGPIPDWYIDVMASLLLGVTNVAVASSIAPRHKFTAALVHTIILGVLTGGFMASAFISGDPWAGSLGLFIIAGAIGMLLQQRAKLVDQLSEAHNRE